jgi:hypothetical protein
VGYTFTVRIAALVLLLAVAACSSNTPSSAGEYTLLFEAPGGDGAGAQSLLLEVQGGTANAMAL